jgi:hypothetical protein
LLESVIVQGHHARARVLLPLQGVIKVQQILGVQSNSAVEELRIDTGLLGIKLLRLIECILSRCLLWILTMAVAVGIVGSDDFTRSREI